jgi:dimethylamine monooxygenase subunit A
MPHFPIDIVAVPFRMQPGLREVPPAQAALTPMVQGSAHHAAKSAVWARIDAGAPNDAALVSEGYDPADLLRRLGQPSLRAASLAVEEDFAVLQADGTVPLLCVALPSHWSPEAKLGLPLASIHAPVADSALLQKATDGLVKLASGGKCWERFVWTFTPSAALDAHPARHPDRVWPDAADPSRIFLRWERQVFRPLPGTQDAVFSIHVHTAPLTVAAHLPDTAQRLLDSLLSMTDAVLAYKGLAAAKPLLAHALQALGAKLQSAE